MNYRERIREAIECHQHGEWGTLNSEQRNLIKRLLDELDRADNCFKRVYLENIKQKEVIDKAVKYIDNLRDESAERQGFYNCFPDDLYIADINELLDILKEVSE